MTIFIRTIPNVMRHFGCTAEDAQRYIDLREEGYGPVNAALMAGLTDPPEVSASDELDDEQLSAFRRARLGRGA